MYLWRHQIIHFICDLYRNQREIFGITKRLLEGKRWEMLLKRSWVTLGLMVISLTDLLRRSCATNLYDNGVPEQVIQETTGHRSVEGVRAYKRTSSAMKRKMSAILNQSESSLGSDHERRNTKKRCDRADAEDQIEQHEVSDKKEVSVCDVGFNALNAKSTKERHDKVETKGESCKNIVITTADTKIKIFYK